MNYILKCWNHLGDTCFANVVARNVHAAYPEIKFGYRGNYSDVFLGNDFYEPNPGEGFREVLVRYSEPIKPHEPFAAYGTLNEGFLRWFNVHTGLNAPMRFLEASLVPQASALESMRPYRGCVVLNANCQRGTWSKFYPYWRKVVALLPDYNFVLMGGGLPNDVSYSVEGSNVTNLRGKTTVAELIALVSLSRGVLSPPSGVCHVAAAFHKPSVTVLGAREPVRQMIYPNNLSIYSHCTFSFYDGLNTGCGVHDKPCEGKLGNGFGFPGCMCAIAPETVAAAVRRHIK